MTTPVARTLPPVYRFPFMATAMAVTSMAALYLADGGCFVIPICAVVMVLSHFFRYRSMGYLSWAGPGVRIIVFPLIALVAANRQTKLSDAYFTAEYLDFFAQCFCAEMALEAWERRPVGTGRLMIFLSAFVFLAGCATPNTGPLVVLAPLYYLFLILAMRQFTNPQERLRPYIRLVTAACSIVTVLAAGSMAQYLFRVNKEQIMNFGMTLFGPHLNLADVNVDGIDKDPALGGDFNVPGSSQRILRIEGALDDPHLRGVTYDTYSGGKWLPRFQDRVLTPVDPAALRGVGDKSVAQVTRYVTDDGMVVAPIDCAGLQLHGDVEAAAGMSAIKAGDAPYQYDIADSGRDDAQGPLCVPPPADDIKRDLAVPHEIDTKVRALAQSITKTAATPQQKIDAVTLYLLRHNSYSLHPQVGGGDPISVFILDHKSGHCEFFGSAATIMLRCAGVPARYVIGYYAHETEGNAIAVRGQDAHAWCEAWVPGTGWLTVDATPSDGRPDRTAQSSWLWRLRDAWQDFVAAIQLALANPGGRIRLVLIAIIVLGGLGLLIAQIVRLRRTPRDDSRGYTAPDTALAQLAEQFDTLLVKRGAACPPNVPWGEHLDNVPAAVLDAESAQRFAVAYSRARFGGPVDPFVVEDLKKRLDRAGAPPPDTRPDGSSNPPTRPSSEETDLPRRGHL